MCKPDPLNGETVILTGIPKSTEPELLVAEYGGVAALFPLIKVKERTVEDLHFKDKLNEYDWLIFTSQNGVKYFGQKMERHQISSHEINPKIAAVGSETERALNEIGLTIQFKPTIYSADRFIVEFPDVAADYERCLFLRGSLAKPTIREGLKNDVDEWTVYETVEDINEARKLRDFLSGNNRCTITFSSPSSVEIFTKEVLPYITVEEHTIAAIGHITEDALIHAGLPVHVKPDRYTMKAMIEKIARMKGDCK